jgi:hypothetical protein
MDLFGVHRRRVAELGAWAAECAIHITKCYRIISQTEH